MSLVGRAINVVGAIGILLIGIGISNNWQFSPDLSMIGALMIGAWMLGVWVVYVWRRFFA